MTYCAHHVEMIAGDQPTEKSFAVFSRFEFPKKFTEWMVSAVPLCYNYNNNDNNSIIFGVPSP